MVIASKRDGLKPNDPKHGEIFAIWREVMSHFQVNLTRLGVSAWKPHVKLVWSCAELLKRMAAACTSGSADEIFNLERTKPRTKPVKPVRPTTSHLVNDAPGKQLLMLCEAAEATGSNPLFSCSRFYICWGLFLRLNTLGLRIDYEYVKNLDSRIASCFKCAAQDGNCGIWGQARRFQFILLLFMNFYGPSNQLQSNTHAFLALSTITEHCQNASRPHNGKSAL